MILFPSLKSYQNICKKNPQKTTRHVMVIAVSAIKRKYWIIYMLLIQTCHSGDPQI